MLKIYGLIFFLLFSLLVNSQELDLLLVNIQKQLALHEISNLQKLQQLSLENLKTIDGESLKFVPVTQIGAICGLVVTESNTPKILYTVVFNKEVEQWIPIEGKAIKKQYWNVSPQQNN